MPCIPYKQFQKLVQSHKSRRNTILRCLLILSNGHPGKDVSENMYYSDEKATPRHYCRGVRLVGSKDHVHIGEVAQTVVALIGGLPTATAHEAACMSNLLHFGGGVRVFKYTLLIGGANPNSRTFCDLLGQSEVFHQKLGFYICFFQTNHFLFIRCRIECRSAR